MAFYYQFRDYDSIVLLQSDSEIDPQIIQKIIDDETERCISAYNIWLDSPDNDVSEMPKSRLMERLTNLGITTFKPPVTSFHVDDWLW